MADSHRSAVCQVRQDEDGPIAFAARHGRDARTKGPTQKVPVRPLGAQQEVPPSVGPLLRNANLVCSAGKCRALPLQARNTRAMSRGTRNARTVMNAPSMLRYPAAELSTPHFGGFVKPLAIYSVDVAAKRAALIAFSQPRPPVRTACYLRTAGPQARNARREFPVRARAPGSAAGWQSVGRGAGSP